MPKRLKFLVRLSGEKKGDEAAVRSVRVTTARGKHFEDVPFHAASKVTKSTRADCYLQIWELDLEDRDPDAYLQDVKKKHARWVATFPGVVARAKKYSFRPTNPPILKQDTVNKLNGKVTLSMTPVDKSEPETFEIPLPEYEGVLELTAVLRTSDNRASPAPKGVRPILHRVRNLEASLRRQIEERGGLAVAFVADYSNSKDDLLNQAKQRREEAQKLREQAGKLNKKAESASELEKKQLKKEVKKLEKKAEKLEKEAKKKKRKTNNDLEFRRQAEEMIATLPTFKLDNGNIKMGFYEISDWHDIADKLDALRRKVKDKLKMETTPKVDMLALYSHGTRISMQIYCSGHKKIADWKNPGSLRAKRDGAEFAKSISSHLSNRVVIPLFACSCGRGNKPNKDQMYGRAYPCEELGGDSLAWTLHRELVKRGIKHPTIWAHTTAAHTTRNPRLRVFSPSGTADFINLLAQTPRLKDTTAKSYVNAAIEFRKFRKIRGPKFRKHLYSADLIRTISLQSALYLPWSWNGGTDATTPAGSRAHAKQQASRVYKEIRKRLLTKRETLKDELVYEDEKRAYITGLAPGVSDTRLSENFRYSEVSSLSNPTRISVQLMKYVQLLSYRTRRSMTLKKIFNKGDGLAIEVSPNTKKNRTSTLKKAREMVDEDLFSLAELKDKHIYITAAPAKHFAATSLKYIYFAIYYRVPDNAFERAAKTWKRKVEKYPSYRKDIDTVIMEEVKTEADFENAWKKVYTKSNSIDGTVMEGHLFTHATKDLGGHDGLEFKPTKTDDGTLTRKEIMSLTKLNWDQNGSLTLAGCNTGLIGKRGWAPALEFAKLQKVKTTGQSGFAYFSQNDERYVEIDIGSTKVYLWAYKRRKNGLFGDGSKMRGITYVPQRKATSRKR